MAANSGIFIRSTKSNDDIIEACNNLMKNSNLSGRIVAVRKSKTYGGVKVYLNGDDIVKCLLEKQFLYESGDDLSTIHPLATHLTVHEAIFSTTEEEFIEALRKIIEEVLGPVLKVSKIPISKLHPDIGNGNWRVLLDIPEIDDLDVYTRSGLPDDLTVKVPGVHERLSITFHCTKCDKDGHIQWRCSGSLEDDPDVALNSVKEEESSENPNRPMSGFFIHDREEENRESDNTPLTKSVLKRKVIRKFESEIGKEEVRNYCHSFQSKKSGHVKKKGGDSISTSAIYPALFKREDKKRVSNSKKARFSSILNEEDSQSENVPKATSTTNDPDCQGIQCESSPSTSSENQPHHFSSPSVGLFARNSVDDFVSTSNLHVPTADTVKSELPSTDENDSDSIHGTSASRPKPVRQRKKPAQSIPIVIPDRIQNIIAEIEDGILDVKLLTAFFNHVKKKSRPCSFAKMYTNDVAGLKRQLDEIKRRYYMIPERGTNVEIQFMKWFVNIIDRFDGTPNTRKKKPTA